MTTVAGIILAAGRGRRFGGDKLLARLNDEISVIEYTVKAVSGSVSDYICVVRSEDEPLQQHLTERNIPWIIAPAADEGMSQSLIAGIENFPEAGGWMVCLGDMPYVNPETYELMCQRFIEQQTESGSPCILVPVVTSIETSKGRGCEKRGNPVLFSHHFLNELRQLKGDTGGKNILAAHPNRVVAVAVDDLGVLADIDVPRDIKHYL